MPTAEMPALSGAEQRPPAQRQRVAQLLFLARLEAGWRRVLRLFAGQRGASLRRYDTEPIVLTGDSAERAEALLHRRSS
jgi:hypothetical protein